MKLKLNISKLYYGIIIIITDEPSCCIERNTFVSEKKNRLRTTSRIGTTDR